MPGGVSGVEGDAHDRFYKKPRCLLEDLLRVVKQAVSLFSWPLCYFTFTNSFKERDALRGDIWS